MVEALNVMNSPAVRVPVLGFAAKIVSIPLAMKTVASTGSVMRNFWGNIPFILGNNNFLKW